MCGQAADGFDRKEAVIIVNPRAHNSPKRARIVEADRWLRARGWTCRMGGDGRPRRRHSHRRKSSQGWRPAAICLRRRRHPKRSRQWPRLERNGHGCDTSGHRKPLGTRGRADEAAAGSRASHGGGSAASRGPRPRRFAVLPAHGQLRHRCRRSPSRVSRRKGQARRSRLRDVRSPAGHELPRLPNHRDDGRRATVP